MELSEDASKKTSSNFSQLFIIRFMPISLHCFSLQFAAGVASGIDNFYLLFAVSSSFFYALIRSLFSFVVVFACLSLLRCIRWWIRGFSLERVYLLQYRCGMLRLPLTGWGAKRPVYPVSFGWCQKAAVALP